MLRQKSLKVLQETFGTAPERKEHLKFLEFVLASFGTAKNVINFVDRINGRH